jgi:hypothetical protein
MILSIFWKTILTRFLKGAVAGAIPIMGATIGSWTDFGVFLNSLAIAGLFGGITGVILALDKAMRWE